MGLILHGTWKGKKYNREEINAHELAKVMGIKEQLFPENAKDKSFVQFELDLTKRRNINGQKRQIKRETIVSTFSVSKKGDSVTITYFSNRQDVIDEKTGHSSTILTPRKVELNKHITTFSREEVADLIVYVALHKKCGTSPLHRKGDPVAYSLKNLVKESNDYLEQKLAEKDLSDEILKEHIDLIRVRAKGLAIPGVDDMSDNVVRAEMLRRLDDAVKGVKGKSFVAFEKKYNAPYSTIRGQVQECLDRGSIVAVSAGGKWHFDWSDTASGAGRICTVPQGKSPNEYLFDFMVSNWSVHHKAVKESNSISKESDSNKKLVDEFNKELRSKDVSEDSPENKGPKAVKDSSVLELIKEAEESFLLTYDHSSKGVKYFTSKGLEKDPVMAVEFKGWQDAFAKRLLEEPTLLKSLQGKIISKRARDSKKEADQTT